MDWRQQLDKAAAAIKQAATNEKVQNLTSKAKEMASDLSHKAKQGALGAAEAFVKANAEPSSLRFQYLGAHVTVASPSDGLEVSRPHAGTLVISDGAGNGLVINAAGDKAAVTETVGAVTRINETTFDVGTEDGVNVVVLKA
jgi:hypothetical protein